MYKVQDFDTMQIFFEKRSYFLKHNGTLSLFSAFILFAELNDTG